MTHNNNETISEQFPNVSDTVLKLSAMMTGDLDFSELPFHIHPIMSRLIFVAFLLLINIVLLNLLIGWAVSDIRSLQDKVYFTFVKYYSF